MPTVPVELDRTHPLAQGLAGYWLLNSPAAPIDLTGNYGQAVAGPGGAPHFAVSGAGPSAYWTSADTNQQGWQVNNTRILGAAPAWTIITTVQTTASPPSYGRVVYCERGPTGGNILKLGMGAAGGSNDFGTVTRNDTSGAIFNTDTTPINDGLLRTLIATYDGTNIRLYQNGVNTATAGVTSGAYTESGVVSTIGYDGNGSGAEWGGSILHCGVYRSTLSPAAIAQLSAEPFAMLRPVVRRNTYYAAAASTASVGTSTGSANVSGTGAAVATATASSAGHGTASGIGQAVSTATGTSNGAATVTGTSVTGASVGTSAGQATVTGQGAATAISTGTSAGAAALNGQGASTAITTASSTGQATASGIGGALVTSTATSSGAASVSGVGSALSTGTSTGTSAGQASVQGQGQALAVSTGTSAGAASLNGQGASTALTTASTAGSATVAGVASALAISTGTASGQAIVTGYAITGQSLATAIGQASVQGLGSALVLSTGSISCGATMNGQSQYAMTAVATALGRAAANAVGSATVLAVGTISGASWAQAVGSALGNFHVAARLASVPAETRIVSIQPDF